MMHGSDTKPIYQDFRHVPPGLATGEQWMLGRRKAISRIGPAAYFRPPDYIPEFGSPLGIPLYHLGQTRPYDPTPFTVATQRYYDFFVTSQNRRRHSVWDGGERRHGPGVTPGWRTHDEYLSRARVRAHIRGKEIYGCWADEVTRWFAIDVDYHGGDVNLFLDVLRVIGELPDFFPEVRWCYALNRGAISGLHLVGLLPTPRLLDAITADVRKTLAYLEDENLGRLRKYRPGGLKDDQFRPVSGLEIYPATNHNFRLPYAADRITVTDEWLNPPGHVDLKANAVRFVDYVGDANRQAVPYSEVFTYIKENVRHEPPRRAKGTTARSPSTGGGFGRGKVRPLKGRHLEFITGVVLGTEAMPDDSIGSWSAAALRHLMLVNGLGQEEALGVMAEFYEIIPDKGFSDRLSGGGVKELLRSDACLARKIAEGNLGQGSPEDSTATFAQVTAHCDRIGFDFADRSTWHVLRDRRRFPFDICGEDFSLTFGEKLAVKLPGAALLKCDTASVYQAAHCVKAFVTKYPGRELPAGMVPRLCEDLPIEWHVPSDRGDRCKKAERFLHLLCGLGLIEVVSPKEWHGVGHPGNRATTYGLPEDGTPGDLGRRWFASTRTRHGPHPVAPRPSVVEGIYITDFYSFSDDGIGDFVGDVERPERPWTPRFHSSG